MPRECDINVEFSFIVPAYNEESNVAPLAERLIEQGERIGGVFEILFVNDGSTDGTARALDALSERDKRIRALHFSRNFGHMAALTAGMDHARAAGAVICLDADGQHPPEVAVKMVELWRAGADVVQGIRESTTGERLLKRTTSSGFYALMNLLSDTRISPGAADFRLLDVHVVQVLRQMPERDRFLRGLVCWTGFRTAYVPFQAPARLHGLSKYTSLKMLGLALNGITSFSVRPLRLSLLFACALILFAAGYGAFALCAWATGMAISAGWTSLVLVVVMLSSVQLFCMGILSEYMARLMTEVKGRPVYIIRERREVRK